jgi:photosystem II stability/assembly factor-like uncharacterized protein
LREHDNDERSASSPARDAHVSPDALRRESATGAARFASVRRVLAAVGLLAAACASPARPAVTSVHVDPRPAAPMDAPRVEDLAVADDARFWIAIGGRALETFDGGETFVDRTPFAPSAEGEPSWRISSIVAHGAVVALLREPDEEVVRSMSLFASRDGGGAFVERSVPLLTSSRGATLQRGPAGSLLVRRYDDGGMNSHESSLVETRDDGTTWRELGAVTGYGAVTFQSASRWWSVGTCCASASSIHRSLDGGRTWAAVSRDADTREPRSDVVFLGARDALRFVQPTGTGDAADLVLERSRDGARSFARVASPAGASAVLLAEAGALVVERGDGELFASLDLGVSWDRLPPLADDGGAPIVRRAPHGWVAICRDKGRERALVLSDGAAAWRARTLPDSMER